MGGVLVLCLLSPHPGTEPPSLGTSIFRFEELAAHATAMLAANLSSQNNLANPVYQSPMLLMHRLLLWWLFLLILWQPLGQSPSSFLWFLLLPLAQVVAVATNDPGVIATGRGDQDGQCGRSGGLG